VSISIILTCYNEVPLIFTAYEKINSMMGLTNIDYDLIIVDDGSEAETKERLSVYFKGKPNVTLILSPVNGGRGMAVTKGIRASAKEYAGFIDTDLEIPEDSIFALYRAINDNRADVAIGRRVYLLRWNINDVFRCFTSRVYFIVANLILDLRHLDTETGVKLFKREKILPLLDSIEDKRWFWDTEIITESIKNRLNIMEVPVFVTRREKRSSVNFLRDSIRYFMALYRYRRKR
jgi:glycosyltransferase involved in cell wall biosynthesis